MLGTQGRGHGGGGSHHTGSLHGLCFQRERGQAPPPQAARIRSGPFGPCEPASPPHTLEAPARREVTMSVSTSVAVGDPFQRYAVEVAGTLPGPGLSPSVAAAGMSSSHGARTGSSGTRSPRHAERPTRPRDDETGRAIRFSRIRIARCAAASRFSASPTGPSRHHQHSTFFRRCNSTVRPQSCCTHEESTPRPRRFPAPQHSHSAGHAPRSSGSLAVSARSRAASSWSRVTMRGTLSRAEAAPTASAGPEDRAREECGGACPPWGDQLRPTGCPAHFRGPSDP